MEINTHQLLVKLDNLRAQPGFDPRSYPEMAEAQKTVANYEAAVALKENPLFVQLLKDYSDEVLEINNWILENAKAIAGGGSESQNALFKLAKLEVLKTFIEFHSKDTSLEVESISSRVNELTK